VSELAFSSTETIVQLLYLLASILFIFGLRDLGHAETARRGVIAAEIGMVAAVVGTLLYGAEVSNVIIRWDWILVAIVAGSAIGTAMGLYIPMTKMPERIALSHAFGGLAVALVGIAEYTHLDVREAGLTLKLSATGLECALGAVTFTGSLVAFGKLQGILPGRPITFPGVNLFNLTIILASLAGVIYVVYEPSAAWAFYGVTAACTLLGVTLVMPIGGADMPVVICLLNSYAGLAASATGFALSNNVLIICGALDGGSGFLLGMMMSKAMNRSFSNVVFGAVGADAGTSSPTAGASTGPAPNVSTVEDAVEVLRAARSLIVVPGYGMAVSQAQHATRDLAAALASNGCDVRYAIHPVAGRMPGHMNVLLAEANVPYDQLFDLDLINDDFASTDVALVVGANDVVNPAARTNKGSPIYGMPILAADQARTCIVLKRSLNPGFAGIENELFVKPNTMMVLGDAKKTITAFTQALKE
jgi:NAD(P) transhydrogenase subunit beta